MKKLLLLLILSLSITTMAAAQQPQQRLEDLPLDKQVEVLKNKVTELMGTGKNVTAILRIRKETLAIVIRKMEIEMIAFEMDANKAIEGINKQLKVVETKISELKKKIAALVPKKPSKIPVEKPKPKDEKVK